MDQRFDGRSLDPRLKWLNPPANWRADGNALVVEPDANTDFWMRTHYKFEADSGHLLFAEATGDVAVSTKVRFYPVHQYDQAGLMLRVDSNCWMKTSVEYEGDDPPRLGAVVTNRGYSDWSVQDFDRGCNELWFRLTRKGSDCMAEYSMDGAAWTMLRLAHLDFDAAAQVECGLYACSPKGAGFRAEFGFLKIERG